ncbi:MAG: tyrosine-type recombinase/integrase [Candidatus Acidiferrales bacterium]
MAKQRQHGTGSVWSKPHLRCWYFSFYRDGKQVQVNTKLAKTEENREGAEKLLAQEIAKKELEIRSDILTLGKITYEDMRDNLIAAFQRNGQASLSVGKDGIARLVGVKYLDKYFAGMALDKMADKLSGFYSFVEKQEEVQAQWKEKHDMRKLYHQHVGKVSARIADGLAREDANMARNATFNRSLSTLRSMYSQFAADYPKRLREGDIPTMPRISAEKSDNVGQGFVTPEIFQKIYDAMPPSLQPLTQFLYVTGMRSGAAKQITWSMVRWEKNVAVALDLPAGLMKNREAYSIPLVGPLAPVAETLTHGLHHVDMPIFTSTNFRRVWNKVCAGLGLGLLDPKTQRYVGLHPHDFRRSASRNLIRAGVPQTVAMKVTGHKSARMFERYNITDTSDVADALVAVGKFSDEAKRLVKDAKASKAVGNVL